MYALLVFVHVLVAIAAMGPHFANLLLIKHMARHPESAPTLAPLVGRLAKLPKHGGMAMLASGILLVWLNPAGWGMFKEFWLAASMALFVVNFLYGRFKAEPAGKELGMAAARGNLTAEGVSALAARMDSHLTVMTVILLLIIALMVFKPTL